MKSFFEGLLKLAGFVVVLLLMNKFLGWPKFNFQPKKTPLQEYKEKNRTQKIRQSTKNGGKTHLYNGQPIKKDSVAKPRKTIRKLEDAIDKSSASKRNNTIIYRKTNKTR